MTVSESHFWDLHLSILWEPASSPVSLHPLPSILYLPSWWYSIQSLTALGIFAHLGIGLVRKIIWYLIMLFSQVCKILCRFLHNTLIVQRCHLKFAELRAHLHRHGSSIHSGEGEVKRDTSDHIRETSDLFYHCPHHSDWVNIFNIYNV